MGQFRSDYQSPHTQRLADRIRQAPAAAKAQVTKPAPKLEAAVVPAEPKVRKAASEPSALSAPGRRGPDQDLKPRKARKVAAPVSDGPVKSSATRTARWRAKQDHEVLKRRNREAVQRWRARKQAGS